MFCEWYTVLTAQKNNEGNCLKIRKAFIENTTFKIWLWEILNDSDGAKGSWGVWELKENCHNFQALQKLWYARLKQISHYLSHYKQPQSWDNVSTWFINYIPDCADTLGSPRSQTHSFWQTWYLNVFIHLIHSPVVYLFCFFHLGQTQCLPHQACHIRNWKVRHLLFQPPAPGGTHKTHFWPIRYAGKSA